MRVRSEAMNKCALVVPPDMSPLVVLPLKLGLLPLMPCIPVVPAL